MMKRLKLMGILACAALALLAGCASTGGAATGGGGSGRGRNIRGNTPQFVKDAVKNQPEDALVGIGTARLNSVSQSRVTAATRGRAEISRQLITIVEDMVRDYTASSEVNPEAALAYQSNITLALSRSALQGSRVVEEDQDETGAYWVVVMMPRNAAAQEVNQAAAAAKLAVPAMAAMNEQELMNRQFERLSGQEIQVQSN
ncbi:MAG: hypothetical protein LBC88_06975 [Spirochaetaceae bacterium]|jgi:type IV pilus biogenesis protein CpaD/CtpE|nr:hypothetical protein [Spirochaetaceae bacterium]